MSEASGDKSNPEPERKLTPTEVTILYWLNTHRKFRGSKVQLRKMMGYPSDGSINPYLNRLISTGYVKEDQTKTGVAFRLTGRGRDRIIFLRLPDYLLVAIGFIGIADLYAAFEYYFAKVPLSPYSDLLGGIALVALYIVIAVLRGNLAKEFLHLREPLEESESTPRDVRDDDSAS